ncbi:MAG: hypothetical protein E6K54_07350 [Gammaproteobacteria bacterium]|nr:MAG: hypothetical protein E6K54_07350 [Gammaproteobacteria bacterium]
MTAPIRIDHSARIEQSIIIRLLKNDFKGSDASTMKLICYYEYNIFLTNLLHKVINEKGEKNSY